MKLTNLQVELEMRKKYEGFLLSVIRSGESLSDDKTFDWFCENYKKRSK